MGERCNKNLPNIICLFLHINFTKAIYDRFYDPNTKFRFIFIARVAQHGHHKQQMWQLIIKRTNKTKRRGAACVCVCI